MNNTGNGLLHDARGNVSSKRVSALVCVIVAVVIAFVLRDNTLVMSFLGSSLALQGVTAFSERGKL